MKNLLKAAVLAFGGLGALAIPAGAQPYDPRDEGPYSQPYRKPAVPQSAISPISLMAADRMAAAVCQPTLWRQQPGPYDQPYEDQGPGPYDQPYDTQSYNDPMYNYYGSDYGYCDPYYGCPDDFYDLPLYYGQVYWGDSWYPGPSTIATMADAGSSGSMVAGMTATSAADALGRRWAAASIRAIILSDAASIAVAATAISAGVATGAAAPMAPMSIAAPAIGIAADSAATRIGRVSKASKASAMAAVSAVVSRAVPCSPRRSSASAPIGTTAAGAAACQNRAQQAAPQRFNGGGGFRGNVQGGGGGGFHGQAQHSDGGGWHGGGGGHHH